MNRKLAVHWWLNTLQIRLGHIGQRALSQRAR